MAFYMGTANNAESLLTALINNCTSNGWINTNGILSKSGCYIQPFVNDNTLAIAGGTGQSGATLTGTVLPNNKCPVSLAAVGTAISYPMTYYLHVLASEVYLVVNFNVDFWSYLAFGQSPSGIDDTGNWYAGTGNGNGNFPIDRISNNGANGAIQLMMFPHSVNNGGGSSVVQAINSFIQHGLDGNSWSYAGTGAGSTGFWQPSDSPSIASATLVCKPLLNRIPNSWNGEAIFLPITPAVYRAENRRTIVGALKYGFYTRNDNYEPGQIVTRGDTKYSVYPWLKKNSLDRNAAGNDKTHSGTFALAVIYEGD